MLWIGTGGTTTSDNCSTGCPTCGCHNPNCPRQLWTISFDRLPTFDPLPVPRPMESWLVEQRRTPRRMKRPFPANKPASHQAYRRACY